MAMKKIDPTKMHSNRKAHNWLAYKLMRLTLLQSIPYIKGSLYDLGCGEAPYKKFFLEYADSYTGVDWSSSLHHTQGDIQADLNKTLPIDSDVADAVVSISVLEHLYSPQTMLNEAHRILKPGGNIIIQVPWQWWIHEQPHDYFRFTPYGLEYMLNAAGFTNIQIKAQCGFFTMWFLKFNYFLNRFVKGPKPIRLIIKLILTPLWFINQAIAPLLDKLDLNWDAETTGYTAIARKP